MPIMTKAGYTPPKENKPKNTPKKKKRKGKRGKGIGTAGVVSLVIFFIALAVGAGTIYIYNATQPYANAFLPGVTLAGYPLGGATWENARALILQRTQEDIAGWSYTLTGGEKTYSLSAQDVALAVDEEATLAPLWSIGREGGMIGRFIAMLQLQREPVSGEIEITYDLAAADALLKQIKTDVESDPVDATFRFAPGNSEPFRFTDEADGYALDTAPLKTGIEKAVASITPGTAEIVPEPIEPAVTRAQLEQGISLRARVRMTLTQDEGGRNNAAIAARMLNGVRIDPGETRTFNEIVGKRVEENGYVAAPEPAYGPYANGVGGGVCQVSTALYRAALLADVTVSERNAAAYPMTDFCEIGQEAAVSDQGLDLALRNDTDAPLFITARTYTTEADKETVATIEIQIIGLPLENRIELVSEGVEGTMADTPVYYRDQAGEYATYTDEQVPVHDGLPGWEATVTRRTLDGEGKVLSTEEISKDSYAPVAPVIYVGTTER